MGHGSIHGLCPSLLADDTGGEVVAPHKNLGPVAGVRGRDVGESGQD